MYFFLFFQICVFYRWFYGLLILCWQENNLEIKKRSKIINFFILFYAHSIQKSLFEYLLFLNISFLQFKTRRLSLVCKYNQPKIPSCNYYRHNLIIKRHQNHLNYQLFGVLMPIISSIYVTWCTMTTNFNYEFINLNAFFLNSQYWYWMREIFNVTIVHCMQRIRMAHMRSGCK